jgi:hypothetical protein
MRKIIGLMAVATAAQLAWSLPAFAQAKGSAPSLANGLSTTVKTVRAGNGALAFLSCYNPNATVAYVQFFDTVGTVTLGTTVPKLSIGVPATQHVSVPVGAAFLAGIKAAATTTATGSTAPGTALDCNFAFQ